jgi:hypothetical protein
MLDRMVDKALRRKEGSEKRCQAPGRAHPPARHPRATVRAKGT